MIRIRFNKTRGTPGRGTVDHVWRVFDNDGKEYLAKNVRISVPSWSHKEERSDDWNIAAEGLLVIDRDTSTINVV
jgi:hypothetical protein